MGTVALCAENVERALYRCGAMTSGYPERAAEVLRECYLSGRVLPIFAIKRILIKYLHLLEAVAARCVGRFRRILQKFYCVRFLPLLPIAGFLVRCCAPTGRLVSKEVAGGVISGVSLA